MVSYADRAQTVARGRAQRRMRQPFRSLSRERRAMRPVPMATSAKKRWFHVSRSDVIAGIGLLISILAIWVSYAQYKIADAAKNQPFEVAKYQIRVDSYKRFNDRIEDWIKLKSEEAELYRHLQVVAGQQTYNKALTLDLSNRAAILSNHTLAFYKAQVIERTYWPDVKDVFDKFDKNIDRTTKCASYVSQLSVDLASKKTQPSLVSAILGHLDKECKFRDIAATADILPYKDVIVKLDGIVRKTPAK